MKPLQVVVAIASAAAVAGVLHLSLGWAWSLGGGVVGGALVGRYGPVVGAAGVALEWAGGVVYTLVVARAPTRLLLDVLGGLLGNIPDALVVAVTILTGALLGLAGGLIGAQGRALLGPEPDAPGPPADATAADPAG
jgi:hypothetical protein